MMEALSDTADTTTRDEATPVEAGATSTEAGTASVENNDSPGAVSTEPFPLLPSAFSQEEISSHTHSIYGNGPVYDPQKPPRGPPSPRTPTWKKLCCFWRTFPLEHDGMILQSGHPDPARRLENFPQQAHEAGPSIVLEHRGGGGRSLLYILCLYCKPRKNKKPVLSGNVFPPPQRRSDSGSYVVNGSTVWLSGPPPGAGPSSSAKTQASLPMPNNKNSSDGSLTIAGKSGCGRMCYRLRRLCKCKASRRNYVAIPDEPTEMPEIIMPQPIRPNRSKISSFFRNMEVPDSAPPPPPTTQSGGFAQVSQARRGRLARLHQRWERRIRERDARRHQARKNQSSARSKKAGKQLELITPTLFINRSPGGFETMRSQQAQTDNADGVEFDELDRLGRNSFDQSSVDSDEYVDALLAYERANWAREAELVWEIIAPHTTGTQPAPPARITGYDGAGPVPNSTNSATCGPALKNASSGSKPYRGSPLSQVMSSEEAGPSNELGEVAGEVGHSYETTGQADEFPLPLSRINEEPEPEPEPERMSEAEPQEGK